MDWIITNKEWIFSGIGVAILIFVLNLLFKTKGGNKNKSKATNSNNIHIQVNGDTKTENTNSEYYSKDEMQVLFIDDQKFLTVENLKKAGWANTKAIKDVTNLDCADVKNANAIFVDINGVGEKLFPSEQGLGLAVALKEKYPEKYIVIYSAQEQGDRFHRALKIVDDTLSKNAEPYEFITILENIKK